VVFDWVWIVAAQNIFAAHGYPAFPVPVIVTMFPAATAVHCRTYWNVDGAPPAPKLNAAYVPFVAVHEP
jgi:hypothetical protein